MDSRPEPQRWPVSFVTYKSRNFAGTTVIIEGEQDAFQYSCHKLYPDGIIGTSWYYISKKYVVPLESVRYPRLHRPLSRFLFAWEDFFEMLEKFFRRMRTLFR